MKYFFTLIFSIVTFLSFSQRKDLVFIGKINKENFSLSIDKFKFLKKMNDSLFDGENFLKEMLIVKDITKGDSENDYYYVKFISENNEYNRLLMNKNNNLFIVNENKEEYTVYDFYFSCKGNDESCSVRLFNIGNEFIWSCRETIICESDSNCSSFTTIL